MKNAIRYFPNLFPDELLYSAVSRYAIQTGSKSFSTIVKELFGNENIVSTWDFPSHIQWFVNNLNSNCYSSEDIIFKNTILPLFYPFLDVERQQYALEQMKGDNGRGLHTKLGVMSSSVNVKNSLNYCPLCISEDLINHKTAYWHRSHNVPGVNFCHKHSISLKDRCPVCGIIIALKCKNEFVPLLEKCINGHNLTTFYELCTKDTDAHKYQSIKVSKSVNYLLNNRIDYLDAKAVNQRYLYYLKEKGLVTPKGTIRQRELLEQFCLYYTNEFLNELNLNINKDSQYNWLSCMLRQPSILTHPLEHILLIEFLTGDISSFFNQNRINYYPFGKAPWLCLNPVAEHYGQPVVNKCTISKSYNKKEPLGTFECSCGFIYSRSGADTCDEDKYKIGRIKAFGEVWEAKLRDIVQNQGGSLRSIARAMKANPVTIKKFVRRLGLEVTWNNGSDKGNPSKRCSESGGRLSNAEKSKVYIQNIKKFISENSGVSRSVIRRNCQKEYLWLYNNNKDLLFSIVPEPIHAMNCNNKLRVDWTTRDNLLYKKVKKEILRILTSEKPQRVTLSRIGKNLGILSMLVKHLDKLPKTKKLLNKFCETTEEYQIRKVADVANRLKNENKNVKTWMVLREAGLKNNCSEAVKQKITASVD